MAHKFTVWVQNPTVGTNIQSADTFVDDNQRKAGFQAGASASAIRVNTALRQANLVITALMNVILSSSSTASVESSVSDLAAEISTRLLIDPHIQNGSAARSIQNGGSASGIGSGSFGDANSITHQNAFGFGVGLVSGRDNQTLVGQFNSPSNSALFGVGYGTGVNDKKTAFLVDQSGNVIVNTTPTTPTSAARKGDLPVASTATPSPVGSNGAAGTSSEYARADHTHKGVSSLKINSTTPRYGDVGPVYAPTSPGTAGQILQTNGSESEWKTDTIGHGTKPIYIKDGVPVGLDGSAGSAYRPIYLDQGVLKAGQELFIDLGSSISVFNPGFYAITVRKWYGADYGYSYSTVVIRIGPIDESHSRYFSTRGYISNTYGSHSEFSVMLSRNSQNLLTFSVFPAQSDLEIVQITRIVYHTF